MKNPEKKKKQFQEITDTPAEKLLGYFPLKSINDGLGVKRDIDNLQTVTKYDFNVYSVLSSLIYARAVQPCSKTKTYKEVFPKLFETTEFSENQMYSCLEFLGSEYEKFIDDEMLIDACMFRLVQIAENIKGISDDFKEAHSSVPWRQIVGFRNGVVHDYGKTDYSIVYEILSNDIYKLKFELEKNDK